jgi:hypothetical protein
MEPLMTPEEVAELLRIDVAAVLRSAYFAAAMRFCSRARTSSRSCNRSGDVTS